jgi:hypothetical protein
MTPPAAAPAEDTSGLECLVCTDIPSNVGGCRSVTIIYTYQFRDGGRIRSIRNSIRTIRSVVPSF